MEVETLGVARSLGWKVHMRCANGYRQETRSMRKCVYRKQLDLETLVCTRGPNFPLGRLEGRLMCPACGNRRVTVVFEPPSNARSWGASGGDRDELVHASNTLSGSKGTFAAFISRARSPFHAPLGSRL